MLITTSIIRAGLTHVDFFFNRGKARKGLVLLFIHRRWSIKYKQDPERTESYRTVLEISAKGPKHKRKKAIRSIFSTAATGTPSLAVLLLTGDETTWERKGDARRRESFRGPPTWRLS